MANNYDPIRVSDGGSSLSVDDGGGSITVDGSVNIGTMPEVEIKNDSGNPIIIEVQQASGVTVTRITSLDNTTAQSVAANATRRQLIIANESGGSVYVKLGSGAINATNYSYIIASNGTLEVPHPNIYTGIVQLLKTSGGTTNLQVTEVTE